VVAESRPFVTTLAGEAPSAFVRRRDYLWDGISEGSVDDAEGSTSDPAFEASRRPAWAYSHPKAMVDADLLDNSGCPPMSLFISSIEKSKKNI
jgi:hypothetical protein